MNILLVLCSPNYQTLFSLVKKEISCSAFCVKVSILCAESLLLHKMEDILDCYASNPLNSLDVILCFVDLSEWF